MEGWCALISGCACFVIEVVGLRGSAFLKVVLFAERWYFLLRGSKCRYHALRWVCVQISKHEAAIYYIADVLKPLLLLNTFSRSRHDRCFSWRATQRGAAGRYNNCLVLFASCTVLGALCMYSHRYPQQKVPHLSKKHNLSAKTTTLHTTFKNAHYLSNHSTSMSKNTTPLIECTPPLHHKYKLSHLQTTTSWWK